MKTLDVIAWDEKIALVSQDDSSIYLELKDEKYKCFSPIKLENETFVKESIKEIDKIGVLSDVLSGSYGKEYFYKYYIDKYGKYASLLDRLSFIGANGLGALEFVPSTIEHEKKEINLSLNSFKTKSIDVYNGQNNDIAFFIARSNSGAGGAKAKGVVKYNPETKDVFINNDGSLEPRYIDAIIKFNTKIGSEEKKYNNELKLEYVYYLLAKESGLNMSESFLETDDEGSCYFITKRFDIDENNEKLHMHSLAGIMSHDASSFSMGYDTLFRVANMLCVSQADKRQIYKTMVFNLVFANRDDHSRNFSFLMSKDCEWSYAPSYDLTYSGSNVRLAHHQLTIDKKMANTVRELSIKKVAKLGSIDNPLGEFNKMIDLKHNRLRELCKKYEVDEELVDRIFEDTKEIDKRFSGRA